MIRSHGSAAQLFLSGLVCILLIAVLIVLFLRGDEDVAATIGTRIDGRFSEEMQSAIEVRDELRSMKTELGSLDKGALDKIDETIGRNDALIEHLEHQDYVTISGGQIASQNLSAAQVVIAGLSIAFTVVLFGVTILTALSLHSYRVEAGRLERKGKALFRSGQREARKAEVSFELAKGEVSAVLETCRAKSVELEASQQEMSRELTSRLERQKAEEIRTREYLDNIAKIHGSAFSELLAALPGDLASSEAMNRLRNKGLELQARMDLMAHHDRDRQWVAISNLSAVGTKVAIPDLVRLRDDPSVDKGISLHAAEAMRKIQSRVDATGGRPHAAGFTAELPAG